MPDRAEAPVVHEVVPRFETTSSHLFWVPGTGGQAGRWVKASALRYGTRLRTPSGGTAAVTGGWTPRQATGWMWDLTVPGDHDFYVAARETDVLAHNCPADTFGVPAKPGVYTIHLADGAKYVGMSTRNIASRVAASVTDPTHALLSAGYTESDIVNVTWMELQPGVTAVTARTVEQTVMSGWEDFGTTLINRRNPEINLGGPPIFEP